MNPITSEILTIPVESHTETLSKHTTGFLSILSACYCLFCVHLVGQLVLIYAITGRKDGHSRAQHRPAISPLRSRALTPLRRPHTRSSFRRHSHRHRLSSLCTTCLTFSVVLADPTLAFFLLSTRQYATAVLNTLETV